MKTSELIRPALDWAVAKCEGYEFKTGISSWYGNKPWFERRYERGITRHPDWYLAYSTDWAQGGPIIERERLCIRPLKEVWGCWVTDQHGDIHALALSGFGPTPLIAAMRCYVASKLGDEVDIPEELQ